MNVLKPVSLVANALLLGFLLQRVYIPIEISRREYWEKIPAAQAYFAEDHIVESNFDDTEAEELALHYLKLANLEILTRLEPVETEDLIIEIGNTGDCLQYAHYTYSKYMDLIGQATAQHGLDEYVRMSIGYVMDRENNNEVSGHAWLEYNYFGKWLPYETTWDQFDSSYRFDPATIDSILNTDLLLDNKSLSYIPIYTMQVTDCEIKCKIREGYNFRNAWQYEGRFEILLKQEFDNAGVSSANLLNFK